jgi:hypothetical protein
MAKVYQSGCWFTLAIIIIISHRWVLIKASSSTHLRQFETPKKPDKKEQGRKE